MADDMTPCDPPCDECGCCCEAMLPTTLNAMIVTLEPVSIAYKLPETIEMPPGPDSHPFAWMVWEEFKKRQAEFMEETANLTIYGCHPPPLDPKPVQLAPNSLYVDVAVSKPHP